MHICIISHPLQELFTLPSLSLSIVPSAVRLGRGWQSSCFCFSELILGKEGSQDTSSRCQSYQRNSLSYGVLPSGFTLLLTPLTLLSLGKKCASTSFLWKSTLSSLESPFFYISFCQINSHEMRLSLQESSEVTQSFLTLIYNIKRWLLALLQQFAPSSGLFISC